jgi:8-oxo-dGTP pyrophosphatase MutT (NUDIX family)
MQWRGETEMNRHRASALCFNQSKWLVVTLRDPKSGKLYLLPPGGEIEPGETPLQAAMRETVEETGYRVHLQEKSEIVVDYLFFWAGKNIQCRTHFFLGELSDKLSTEHAASSSHGESALTEKSASIEDSLGEASTAQDAAVEGHAWLTTEVLLQQLEFHSELKRALTPWIKAAYESFASKKASAVS